MVFELNQFRETPYDLQFVFVGKMYQWQYNTTFGSGVTNYQIHTSSNVLTHLTNRTIRTASTSINIQFIEVPVFVSTGTTLLPAYDVNRISATTPTLAIYSNPSATSGTVIENIDLIAGEKWNQVATEFILNQGADYLIRVSNTALTAQSVDFNYVWYESSN